MEIILLIAALAATPFGAALLNKPTRKRVVRYVQIHAINPLKKRDNDPEFLPIEPRKKDWGPDTSLQTLWHEAFDWFAIQNRENVLRWALEKYNSYEEKMGPLREKQKELELQLQMMKRASSAYDYNRVTRDFRDTMRELNRRINNTDELFKSGLTSEEKFALKLYKKYGKELHYGNDLIRLATQVAMPELDYVALAVYASK